MYNRSINLIFEICSFQNKNQNIKLNNMNIREKWNLKLIVGDLLARFEQFWSDEHDLQQLEEQCYPDRE